MSDTDFFRYKVTYPTGDTYFSRSYRAKGPASGAITREKKYGRNHEKVYTLQKLGVENGELAWYDL